MSLISKNKQHSKSIILYVVKVYDKGAKQSKPIFKINFKTITEAEEYAKYYMSNERAKKLYIVKIKKLSVSKDKGYSYYRNSTL